MITVIENRVKREPLAKPFLAAAPAPPPPPERQEAPRTQWKYRGPARLLKLTSLPLAFVAAGFCIAGLFVDPWVEISRTGTHTSPQERELNEVLERLRSTWDQRVRARILAEAPQQAWRFGGPLQRLLRQKGYPLLEPAVEYAGATGLQDLAPIVQELAKSGKARARPLAMHAAEKLQPWPVEQLAAFLGNDITPVQIAALEVAARRQDAPWERVFALLVSPDQGVRQAALEAVPAQLPPDALNHLWTMAHDGLQEGRLAALRALARTEITAEQDRALGEELPLLEPDAQLAVLDVLAARKGALASTAAVRALAASSTEATAVRARALYCLEQSGSHDLAELRAWTDTSPLLEYFVARGLVQARDYAGITTLFELAESDDQSTATASRWLLAALAGTSPTAEIDAFQQALPQGSTEWHARALPAPAVGF